MDSVKRFGFYNLSLIRSNLATQSMTNQRIACILGARRSGTNYLETLVEQNFGSQLQVADLNREHSAGLSHRPHLYETLGSKHSLDDRPFTQKFRSENIHLVIVRHPEDWLQARIRYALKHMKQQPKQISKSILNTWLTTEYVAFYNTVLLWQERIPNFLILHYENLKQNFCDEIHRIAKQFSLYVYQPMNIEMEIGPAGSGGKNLYRPFAPDERYTEMIANLVEHSLCENFSVGLGLTHLEYNKT